MVVQQVMTQMGLRHKLYLQMEPNAREKTGLSPFNTFIVVLVLLILGLFLEGIAVIVLTVPLFLPVMTEIGVDPVQFGVIMIMCSMVGLLTPPVGMVLFAVSSVAGMSVGRLSKALMPYLLGIAFVLLLVVTVPAVSIWLPNVVMGP